MRMIPPLTKEAKGRLLPGSEGRGHRLVASVLRELLLPVETQRLEHRSILDREEDRRVSRGKIGVLVQGPGRERDDVSPIPREARAVDDRLSAPLDDVVDGAAGVAVRLESRAGTEHLDPAPHRR